MRLSWFGDFFGALPDVLRAVYRFGDPNGVGKGYWGVIIMAIWGALLIGGPLMTARKLYGKHEWASATLGALGGMSLLWWVFGVVPSAWIYFVDANKGILEHDVIPSSMGFSFRGTRLDIASDLFNVIRDSVVMGMMTIGLVATIWGAILIQRRFPRTLAPGEERPEAGGYH